VHTLVLHYSGSALLRLNSAIDDRESHLAIHCVGANIIHPYLAYLYLLLDLSIIPLHSKFPQQFFTPSNFKMRFIIASACLAQICSAFYPYHLPTNEGTSPSETTSRTAEHRRSISSGSKRSAFYPYHQPATADDHSSIVPPRAVQHPRSDENGSLRVLLRRRLTKRGNSFNIIPATEPTQSNSLGIDQDGTDFSYFCAFQFGSSSQDYYLLLDSAASNTWVMSSDCSSTACSVHNTFGSSDSSSLKVISYLNAFSPWH
jgi:hypothetical protein